MDDRLRICLWMVGLGGFGSVLGGAFGALTGILYARSGGAAGTGLARRVAESLLDAELRTPSDTRRAALVGAVDGFLFLGVLGLITGVFLAKSGRSADELLVPLVVGSVLMVGGAIFFGTLAHALTYRGARLLYGFAGGIIGSLFLGSLLGSEYGAGGVVAGMMLAQILCLVVRGYSPRFQSPQIDKTIPKSRSHSSTDITGPPPHHNDEFFPKDG